MALKMLCGFLNYVIVTLKEVTIMANPYQRAIFVLQEISKIQSHIVPIRIFKMHKIIVDY